MSLYKNNSFLKSVKLMSNIIFDQVIDEAWWLWHLKVEVYGCINYVCSMYKNSTTTVDVYYTSDISLLFTLTAYRGESI